MSDGKGLVLVRGGGTGGGGGGPGRGWGVRGGGEVSEDGVAKVNGSLK